MILMLLVSGFPESPMDQADILGSLMYYCEVEVSVGGLLAVVEAL